MGQPAREGIALKLDQRPWQARARTIEEEPHAERFRSLYGNKPQLPAHMIHIIQVRNEFLVAGRIALKLRDSALNALAETRADLEAFMADKVEDHGKLLVHRQLGKEFF